MKNKKKVNSDLEKRVGKLKSKLENIHDEALEISGNLVDVSLDTGEKYQKLMAKALDKGTVLFGKQQEIVLSAMEEMKAQYVTGTKRFLKLVGLNLSKSSSKTMVNDIDDVQILEEEEEGVKSADDLTIIDGIGPKIALLLNSANIYSFKQLANTELEDLQSILEKAGPIYKAHKPETWRKQAIMILKGELQGA